MATQYYTYNAQTKKLTPVHGPIRTARGWVPTPTAQEWAARGAYPRGNATPTPPEGKIAVLDGYELVDSAWVPQYRYEDAPPPPPRIFSKLKVVAALTSAGVWPTVKQFIIDADIYDLYLAAQEFAEDNEYFTQGKSALQQALGWTDEQVEAILAASVKEGA